MEKHYVFLKDNKVKSVLVFLEKDDALAQRVCDEQGYDLFIWLDEDNGPDLWSTYDSATKTFIPPTNEYLTSIGVLTSTPVVEKVI